jgi:hypothetical protein
MKKFVVLALLILATKAVISGHRIDKVPVSIFSLFRVMVMILRVLYIRVILILLILQENYIMYLSNRLKDLTIKIHLLCGLMEDLVVLHF